MNRTANNYAGSQACAACKYQRRKCVADCPLAPFFPPHFQKEFLNAHKLFGVKKISKSLAKLQSPERSIAAKTMIIQANARANDPVGGCYRMIYELQRQIDLAKAELDLVLNQLAICRAQVANQQQQPQIHVPDHQNIGVDALNVYDGFPLQAFEYDQQSLSLLQQQQEQERNIAHNNCEELPSQNYTVFDAVSVKVEAEEGTSHSSSTCDKQGFVDVSEDVKPLLAVFDEREGSVFLESKDVIPCSDKLILKDDARLIQLPNQDHELKDAAASLCSLTNGKGDR